MSYFSQFFGNSGALYAVPPKKIVPAGWSGNGSNPMLSNISIPLAAGATTYIDLGTAGSSNTGTAYLRNISSGAVISSITAASISYGTSPVLSVIFAYNTVNRVFYLGAIDTSGKLSVNSFNDETGAITIIISGIAVNTPANWKCVTGASPLQPSFCYFANGIIYVNNNGVTHTINVASKAITSQDVPITLSDGTIVPANLYNETYNGSGEPHTPYITADNSAAIIFVTGQNGASSYLSFAKSGIVANNIYFPPDGVVSNSYFIVRTPQYVALVSDMSGVTASPYYLGWRFYDPVDFDRYVQDLISSEIGV